MPILTAHEGLSPFPVVRSQAMPIQPEDLPVGRPQPLEEGLGPKQAHVIDLSEV